MARAPVRSALPPVGAAVLMLAACGSRPDAADWTSVPTPTGPCYAVNLADGLSEVDSVELGLLFDCLDQDGSLAPFAGVFGALGVPAADGLPAGAQVGRLWNTLPGALDFDLVALLGEAQALLAEDPPLLAPLLELAVESLYGQAYGAVVAAGTPADASTLDRGLVTPLIPVVADAADAVRVDGPAIPRLVADALVSPTTDDALCTLQAIATTDDPAVQAVTATVLPHLGAAIDATRSPANDRWPGATGDSAQDLVRAIAGATLADGTSLRVAAAPTLEALLADPALAERLRLALLDAEAGGHLAPLAAQLGWMATVNAGGAPLSAGEDSALHALLRLLAQANQPFSCAVDLGFTTLEADLGNLSVTLLRTLAAQDPAAAVFATALLGEALGWGLTESTLSLIAGTGLCPVLDDQLVADLPALDRFNDPPAGDLVVVLLNVLDAFITESPSTDRLPALVDALDLVYSAGLVPPLEELLRDAGGSPFLRDILLVLPVVLDSSRLGTPADCAPGAAPLAWSDAFALLSRALRDGPDGPAAVATLGPVLDVVLAAPGTWVAVGNAAPLLQASGARLQSLPALSARLLARAEPDASARATLAALIEDPALREPTLLLLGHRPLGAALAASTADAPGPLPFAARLVTSGTLTRLLTHLDALLRALGAPTGEPSR